MNDSAYCQDYADSGMTVNQARACCGLAPLPDFTIGDVVALRGQPQLMTVESYCGECGSISVVWFAGNEDDGWTLERDAFDADMLVNLDGDD